MPIVCSAPAAAISAIIVPTRAMTSTTACIVVLASSTRRLPASTCATELAINVRIFFAAPAERWASARISEATTAHPLPCSPARRFDGRIQRKGVCLEGAPVDDGHGAGDQVIRRLADRVGANPRAADFVARPGGDEFGLIVEDMATCDVPQYLATTLIASMADPLRIGEHLLKISTHPASAAPYSTAR